MVTALCWGTVSIMVQSWRVLGGWEAVIRVGTQNSDVQQYGASERKNLQRGAPVVHRWVSMTPWLRTVLSTCGSRPLGVHRVARGWTGSWNGMDADTYPDRE